MVFAFAVKKKHPLLQLYQLALMILVASFQHGIFCDLAERVQTLKVADILRAFPLLQSQDS